MQPVGRLAVAVGELPAVQFAQDLGDLSDPAAQQPPAFARLQVGQRCHEFAQGLGLLDFFAS